MALPSFDIDTRMAYHVAQQNILQRLDAGADIDDVRAQWRQTIDRIIDHRIAGEDALVFVRAPELGADRETRGCVTSGAHSPRRRIASRCAGDRRPMGQTHYVQEEVVDRADHARELIEVDGFGDVGVGVQPVAT